MKICFGDTSQISVNVLNTSFLKKKKIYLNYINTILRTLVKIIYLKNINQNEDIPF